MAVSVALPSYIPAQPLYDHITVPTTYFDCASFGKLNSAKTLATTFNSSHTSSSTHSTPSIPSIPSKGPITSTGASPSTMAPITLSSKDTSSSAGKVFAKPSKEWVLPERAKPGRKVSCEEPDNKRQSQNRQSQRAHRARKTDYISTLEERLRAYEADEIHSNVRLQEVARALKADNERMKAEMSKLREQVAVNTERWEVEKAGLMDTITNLQNQVDQPSRHLTAPATARPRASTLSTRPQIPTPLPRQTRPLADCPICPDPDPDCPCQQQTSLTVPQPQVTPRLDVLTLAAKALANVPHCGVCQSADECLCAAVEEHPPDHDLDHETKPDISSLELGCGLCTSGDFCACKTSSSSPTKTTTTTATVNTAVPLRLARTGKAKVSVWALQTVQEAVCTGDPQNCEACRNDSFGREFCENLFENPSPVASSSSSSPTGFTKCTHVDSTSCAPQQIEDTMRADEAWKALKAHPNARFASLSLLADVVARRTPAEALSTHTSPRENAHIRPAPASVQTTSPLTVHSTPPPTSGKKRRMNVETSAVRDALKLLDSTPAPSPVDDERQNKRLRAE
ncbi:hypothetical protein BCR39DRAFT_543531 [Naematelia encephala]|uniref:BZIP domain-containing protein n=1 Tax=Naematelia encephala TaxID=71784 RepID=A0A1Y2AT50_9TREE|nr:hypothetical protein BCR39DRAFT_543531 [Naematelia encephala]